MVPVLEAIKNSKLKKFTLIDRIDRKRKEYWQVYLNQAKTDIDYESKEIKKQTEKIINKFSLAGLTSRDHHKRNFILYKNSIYAIDLETFGFH